MAGVARQMRNVLAAYCVVLSLSMLFQMMEPRLREADLLEVTALGGDGDRKLTTSQSSAVHKRIQNPLFHIGFVRAH